MKIRSILAVMMALALTFAAGTFNEARAGDTISVSGSTLKITGSVTPTYMAAQGLTISYTGPNVILKNGSVTYTISFSRIAVPIKHGGTTTGTLRNMLYSLDSMANIARGGIAGTATSGNQTTQITAEQLSNTHESSLLSEVKNMSADSGFRTHFDSALQHTTLIVTGAGYVESVVVGVAGASGNVIRLYDNTTLLGIIPAATAGVYKVHWRFTTSLKMANEGGATAARATTSYLLYNH